LGKVKKKMKVLITGGTGFLGGRIAQHLSAQNYQIYLGTRKNKEVFDWLPEACVFHTDWENMDSFKSVCEEVDIIIHAAGMNAIESQKNPVEAFNFNGMKTAELVAIAEKTNVKKFIYFSTAHVYSRPLIGKINENTCPSNLHPYATSHLFGEYAVLGNAQEGNMQGLVVRLSNAFGAPVDENVNCWMLLVNDLCRQAIIDRKLVLHTAGLQYRDFVSIGFVESAIFFLINNENSDSNHNIFNIGSGKSIRVLDMAEKIQQRCELLFNYTPELSRIMPGNDKNMPVLSYMNEKLLNSGFRYEEDVDAEIDATLEFCRKVFGENK